MTTEQNLNTVAVEEVDFHVPTKEQLQSIDRLEVKKRAISAGMVVALDPDEADRLGIQGMDTINPDDENLEQQLLDSRFDSCEFELDSYQITPDSLFSTDK